MNINNKYIRQLEESELDISEGLFFGFLLTFKDKFPGLEDYILDDHVFPFEKFQIYQINLCYLNTNTNKMELKIPLFAYEDDGKFQQFLELLKANHIVSTGHVNRKLPFSIFGEGDMDAFVELIARKNINLEKLAHSTAEYYQNTEYATKLEKYLRTSALQDYDS